MSYKHLLPTFRNRYLFVTNTLFEITKDTKSQKMLNFGTGEGDYDMALSLFTHELIACDINENDIEVAKQLNKNVANLKYDVNTSLNTHYADHTFDIIVCTEVIEHVGKPDDLLKEIRRILNVDGIAIFTFPVTDFPITYDAINYLAQKLKMNMPFIKQGAYAFGHDYLINYTEFCKQATDLGFEIKSSTLLSGYLIGLLEMYWSGILQYLFKSNRKNLTESLNKSYIIRPKKNTIPLLTIFTDFVINVDRIFFTRKNHSIGKGVVLIKHQ